MNQNIILTTDYHDENCVIRWLDESNGKEQLHKIPTCAKGLSDMVARAEAIAKPRLASVLREHRLESPGGKDLIDVLIGRLEGS